MMLCTGYQNANTMTATQCSVNTKGYKMWYWRLQRKLQSRDQQEWTHQVFWLCLHIRIHPTMDKQGLGFNSNDYVKLLNTVVNAGCRRLFLEGHMCDSRIQFLVQKESVVRISMTSPAPVSSHLIPPNIILWTIMCGTQLSKILIALPATPRQSKLPRSKEFEAFPRGTMRNAYTELQRFLETLVEERATT